jgi:PAS domain S-box-containing protein
MRDTREDENGRGAVMKKDAEWKEKLRREAERHAAEKKYAHPEDMPPEEMRAALHELHVHQIELQMQNEELREAQAEVESARERYFDLYDIAPVGYCTMSEKGIILEANLTIANLFGAARGEIIGKPFSRYIYREDQDVYYLHKLRLCEQGEPQSFELRMKRGDAFFWADINATALHDKNGENQCRATVSDISERKLAEEERAFQAHLLSIASEAITATDGSHKIVYWNEAAKRLYGFSAAEALGQPAGIIAVEVPGEDRDDAYKQMLRDGFWHGEAVYRRKDGTPVRIEANTKVLRDERGEFAGTVTSSTDITERKRDEEQLLYQSNLLSSVHDAIAAVDADLKISYWNDIAEGITGWTPEEVIGVPAEELYDRIVVDIPIGEVVGKFDRDGCFLGEVTAKKKGGEPFFADVHIRRITDPQGREKGAAASFRDITERKRAEEALRESEARFRSVLDNSIDVIYSLNVQTGHFEYVSPSAKVIMGYTPEQYMAMNSEEALAMIHPDDLPSMRKALARLHETGKAEAIYRQRASSGKYRWISNNMSLIRDSAGQPLYRNGNIRDITERKKVEDEINRQNIILQAIKKVYERYVYCGTLKELGESCLNIIEDVTKSNISFISELSEDGLLREISFSLSSKKKKVLIDKDSQELLKNHSEQGLFKSVILEGKSLLSNDPPNHPDCIGIPQGHHLIGSLIGVPFFHNGKVAGMIAAANREGGYTEDDMEMLEALAPTVCEVMLRKRAEEALRKSEERQAFLLKLSDTIRELDDPNKIQDTIARIVGEHMGVDRAGYGEMIFENGKECFRIEYDYHKPGMPDLTGNNFPIADYGPAAADSISSGQALAVADIETDERFTPKERKAYKAVGIRAVVNVPLIKGGNYVANFGVQHSKPREWTAGDIALLKETVERTRIALERARAETALRESEEKYRELVEHSPAAIYELDFRAGRFTSVNDAMCDITGYSRDELLDMPASEILDEPGKIKFRQRVSKWLSGEKPEETTEFKVVGKDGREIYALLNVKFTRDEKGDPLGASVIGHDITESKQNEKKINSRNMILQAIKKIYEQYVYCGTLEELGEACLEITENVTGSKTSFVGEIGQDGLFHDIAVSAVGCEECRLQDKSGHKRLPGHFRIQGLYGSVLKTGEPVLSNAPYSHPDSGKISEEHIVLTSFLGIPFFQNSSIAGMIAVANREGGYTEDEKEILEALAPTVCEVLLRKRTEEALKESENKYQQLVKYAPAGIYEIDFSKRRFTSVNDIICQLSGYSREELLEMDPYDLLDKHSRAKLQVRINRWLKGEEPEQLVDYKVKAKDGRMIDVLMNVSIKLDENGKPARATAVAQDITLRKKNEALINRQNKILQVINYIHERFVSCRTMNELELSCLDIAGAVAKSGVSFIGELKGERLMYEISLSPGGRNGMKNVNRRLGRLNDEGLFKDVIDSKASLLVNDISGPGSTGVNGSNIKISSFLGVPFIRDGEVLGLIAAANREGGYSENEREILEALAPTIYEVLLRKRAEEALKESEERLADEFNAITRIQKISASFVQEGDFDNILYNILKAAIMIAGAYKGTLQLIRPGTEHLEIVAQLGFDQQYIDFFSSASHDSDRVCAKALQQEKRIIVEDVTKNPIFMNTPALDIQLAAGVRAMQCTPLISRRGKVIGILSTHWDRPFYPSDNILRYIDLLAGQAADIIERKRTEEDLRESEECALALVKKLEEADRNKNDFLSALSHEIRNPLATISAGLQLMDISQDESHIKNAKEIIDRQMEQLCSLVDDLLDLTRISNNRIELKKKRVELGRLVSLVAKDHMLHSRQKGLKFETELGEEIYVDADPVRIKQIIGNLLHNAFKFTETGEVNLSVYEESGQAVVCVRDSGVGINPENLSRIFEPFMQINSHMDKRSGGLGLGLSIVKAIAQLHGGDAGVYSEGEGMGSSFFIRLPAVKDDTSGGEESEPAAEKANLKVLLIEDNRDYSEMTCELLRFLGHEVVSAADGLEGIEKANEYFPDVIICDIGLPGINGFETARRIREEESIKNVFLVSLTGYAGPQYAVDSEKAGFDMHITKPVDIDALRHIFNEASGKRRS